MGALTFVVVIPYQSIDISSYVYSQDIYGIRIVMTGAEIDALLSSDTVALVEILNFDNNSLITPIR